MSCCGCFPGLCGSGVARSKRKPHVAVIGDFIVDVQAKVPSMPVSEKEVVESPIIEVLPGGSASNTARQLATLVPSVTFFSTVGDDQLGAAGLAQLRSQGFDTSQVQKLSLPSSACVVLSGPRDRGMVTCYSTVDAVSTANIDATALLQCDHLHIGGYFGLRGLHTDAFLDLVRRFRAAGGSVSLGTNADPSGSWLGQGGHLRHLLPLVDLFIANEREVAECERALEFPLHEVSPGLAVATTCGERGASVRPGGGGKPILVPATSVAEPEDLTGAGDAFAAGFISRWIRDRNVTEAARWGNACASIAVCRRGACAMPAPLAEVEAALRDPAD